VKHVKPPTHRCSHPEATPRAWLIPRHISDVYTALNDQKHPHFGRCRRGFYERRTQFTCRRTSWPTPELDLFNPREFGLRVHQCLVVISTESESVDLLKGFPVMSLRGNDEKRSKVIAKSSCRQRMCQ